MCFHALLVTVCSGIRNDRFILHFVLRFGGFMLSLSEAHIYASHTDNL